jgi:hypothetical protein
VHRVNPNLIVSVSPAPYPWCYENFACDWPAWMKWTGGEQWDECIPQNYRLDFPKTRASIEEGLKVIGDRRGSLLAGVLVVDDEKNMPAADLIKCLQYTRQQKLAGHVLWFSRGVLDVYPEQLKSFYDVAHAGQAPHPARPLDWRSMPLVAFADAGGIWKFRVEKPGKYLAISKQTDGRWTVLGSKSLDAGDSSLAVPDASAVELLPDRKP